MAGKSNKNSAIAAKLETAISDLRAFENLLLSDEVDARLLGDFRTALNRVRNVAWVAQQSAAARFAKMTNPDFGPLLASERVRAAYQLCRAVQEDLDRQGTEFQKGQLAELHSIATALARQLSERI